MLIEARLRMLPAEKSGWHHKMLDQARPMHKFDDSNLRYVGQIDFASTKGPIAPGETAMVWVTFMDVPGLADQLTIGRVWEICSGPSQVIGRCEVVAILSA